MIEHALSGPPRSVSFDGAQTRLAVVEEGGTVLLWELYSHADTRPLEVRGSAPFVCAEFFHQADPSVQPLLVTAEEGGRIRVWDIGPPKRPEGARSLRRSAAELGGGEEEGESPPQWQTVWEVPQSGRHSSGAPGLATAAPLRGGDVAGPGVFASWAADGVLNVFSAVAKRHLFQFRMAGPIASASFLPGGYRFLVADETGSLQVLDVRDSAPVAVWEAHRGPFLSVDVAPTLPASDGGSSRSQRDVTSEPESVAEAASRRRRAAREEEEWGRTQNRLNESLRAAQQAPANGGGGGVQEVDSVVRPATSTASSFREDEEEREERRRGEGERRMPSAPPSAPQSPIPPTPPPPSLAPTASLPRAAEPAPPPAPPAVERRERATASATESTGVTADVAAAVSSAVEPLEQAVRNLHLELLRQMHSHKRELRLQQESLAKEIGGLREEVRRLREENEVLRNLH